MNPQMQVPLQTLPPDFDGVFRFTNWTDRDFTSKWNGQSYTFPAMKTSPIVIPTASPYEVQNIRKKFAKELAELEFYRSKEYSSLDAKNQNPGISGGMASMVGYAPTQLETFVQKCLEPLAAAPAPIPVTLPKEDITFKAIKRVKSRQSGDDTDESLTEGQTPIL